MSAWNCDKCPVRPACTKSVVALGPFALPECNGEAPATGSATRQMFLDYLREHGTMTIADAVALAGSDHHRVRSIFKNMRTKGMIVSLNQAKTGQVVHYALKEAA